MEFIEYLYHADIMERQVGDLRLYCCGRRTGARNHSFGPAARDHFWLIYLKEGSGYYEVGQKRWRLTRGMIFTAFPNRRIRYQADPESVWSISWVSIGAPFLQEYLAMIGVTEEEPIVTPDAPLLAEGVFSTLLSEVPTDTVQSKFRCQSLIYRLLSLMTASSLAVADDRDPIDEALFYMTANYDRPLTVSEVAGRTGLDRSYFARRFRERLGITPVQWLNQYRIDRARSLLHTDLKIGEIARSVGFPDALYFSRRFKKLLGISPTEYRAKLSPKCTDLDAEDMDK